MSILHTMRTNLTLVLGAGPEREVEVKINYWFTPAWPQSSMDPGSDATVEIDTMALVNGKDFDPLPSWFVDLYREDDTLIAYCFEDRADSDAYARDQRDDARREEAMLERGA